MMDTVRMMTTMMMGTAVIEVMVIASDGYDGNALTAL